MRRLFFSVLTILSTASCESPVSHEDFIQKEEGNIQMNIINTTGSPNIDSTGLKISEELIKEIEAEVGKPYEVLNEEIWKYTREDEETYFLDTGLFFDFVREEKAQQVYKKYHDRVEEEGYYLFLSKLDFDESYATYYDIIIMPAKDQFDIIDQMATDGLNYDIYTDEIIIKMKEWHNEVGFEICVVDQDRIEAYMTKKPSNLKKFCSNVYEFCPDVIDQGYGTMDAMIADLETNQYFWLWWD